MKSLFKKQQTDRKKAETTEHHRPTKEEAEQAVRTLLRFIGENPEREGLRETPARVIKSYNELFSGYQEQLEDISKTSFTEIAGYDEPVLVRDIHFFSHCEHHMVPIIGKAYIAYIPDGKLIGLSKISRIVELFARRLQTQEVMTAQIADSLEAYIKPKGVAVLLVAEHLCMAMRGVKKQGSTTITTAFRGQYNDNIAIKADFMRLTEVK